MSVLKEEKINANIDRKPNQNFNLSPPQIQLNLDNH